MSLTPRQILIEGAAKTFCAWNHKALRLEAGVPTVDVIRSYESASDGTGTSGCFKTYITIEPMDAHDALEATVSEFGTVLARFEAVGEHGKVFSDAVNYYADTSDNALERLCREVHKIGMQLLDIALAGDFIFATAMDELEVLAAARRVFNRTCTQRELDLAVNSELIDWEVRSFKGNTAFTPTATFKFSEFWRGYEERPMGGVLPRRHGPKATRLKTRDDWGIA